MKTLHQHVTLSGNVTTVLLKNTDDPLQNDPNSPYKYPEEITHTIGRCTNIYANRTTNWCSHCIGAILLFRFKYIGRQIPVPTPNINKRFKYLTNITDWVKHVEKMDYDARTQYWENMLNNSHWLTAEDEYTVKNMWKLKLHLN